MQTYPLKLAFVAGRPEQEGGPATRTGGWRYASELLLFWKPEHSDGRVFLLVNNNSVSIEVKDEKTILQLQCKLLNPKTLLLCLYLRLHARKVILYMRFYFYCAAERPMTTLQRAEEVPCVQLGI